MHDGHDDEQGCRQAGSQGAVTWRCRPPHHDASYGCCRTWLLYVTHLHSPSSHSALWQSGHCLPVQICLHDASSLPSSAAAAASRPASSMMQSDATSRLLQDAKLTEPFASESFSHVQAPFAHTGFLHSMHFVSHVCRPNGSSRSSKATISVVDRQALAISATSRTAELRLKSFLFQARRSCDCIIAHHLRIVRLALALSVLALGRVAVAALGGAELAMTIDMHQPASQAGNQAHGREALQLQRWQQERESTTALRPPCCRCRRTCIRRSCRPASRTRSRS